MTNKAASSVSRPLQWLVGLAVSLVALGVALRGVHIAEMVAALRQTNYVWVAVALGFDWLGLYFRALSWYIILERRVPYLRAFSALNEGYLLNNILPLRLGEVGRAYLVSRKQTFSASQALSSVLVERVIDLCMVVGLLGTFLPIVAGLEWARQAALTSVVITVLALGGLFALARCREEALGVFRRVAVHVPRLNRQHWELRLGAFIDGMEALRDGRRFAAAAVCSAMAWVCSGVTTSVLLLSLPLHPGSSIWIMGFFTLVITGLGAGLPSAPASAGVFELSVVAALSVFKVDSSLALSYALVYHLVFFGLTTILGAWELAREGESVAHLVQVAQTILGG
jgi:glycosyltransferase 2 family protein